MADHSELGTQSSTTASPEDRLLGGSLTLGTPAAVTDTSLPSTASNTGTTTTSSSTSRNASGGGIFGIEGGVRPDSQSPLQGASAQPPRNAFGGFTFGGGGAGGQAGGAQVLPPVPSPSRPLQQQEEVAGQPPRNAFGGFTFGGGGTTEAAADSQPSRNAFGGFAFGGGQKEQSGGVDTWSSPSQSVPAQPPRNASGGFRFGGGGGDERNATTPSTSTTSSTHSNSTTIKNATTTTTSTTTTTTATSPTSSMSPVSSGPPTANTSATATTTTILVGTAATDPSALTTAPLEVLPSVVFSPAPPSPHGEGEEEPMSEGTSSSGAGTSRDGGGRSGGGSGVKYTTSLAGGVRSGQVVNTSNHFLAGPTLNPNLSQVVAEPRLQSRKAPFKETPPPLFPPTISAQTPDLATPPVVNSNGGLAVAFQVPAFIAGSPTSSGMPVSPEPTPTWVSHTHATSSINLESLIKPLSPADLPPVTEEETKESARVLAELDQHEAPVNFNFFWSSLSKLNRSDAEGRAAGDVGATGKKKWRSALNAQATLVERCIETLAHGVNEGLVTAEAMNTVADVFRDSVFAFVKAHLCLTTRIINTLLYESLAYLDLSYCILGKAIVETIVSRCPNIVSLVLSHVNFDDGAFVAFSEGLSGLRSLDLSGFTHVKVDDLIAVVKAHPFLEYINMSGNAAGLTRDRLNFGYTEFALPFAPYVANLVEFNYSQSSIQEKALSALAQSATSLSTLTLARCQELRGVAVFAEFKNLTSLDLSSSLRISNLHELGLGMNNLRILNLAYHNLVPSTFDSILDNCPGVVDLDVSFASGLETSSLLKFTIREEVSRFVAKQTNVTDEVVLSLTYARFLADLDVSGCVGVTDASVPAVLKACVHLGRLNVADTCIAGTTLALVKAKSEAEPYFVYCLFR